MKKSLLALLLILALTLSACGYVLVERREELPEEVLGFVDNLFGPARAEQSADPVPLPTEQPDAEPATPPAEDEPPIDEDALVAGEIEAEEEPGFVPLSEGSRGDEVKQIQSRLLELGFMTSNADGIFGAKTDAGVRALKEYLHNRERAELEAQLRELEAEAEPTDGLDPTETPEPSDTIDPTATVEPTETVAPDPTATPTEEEIINENSGEETGDAESEEAEAEEEVPEFDGVVDESLYALLVGGEFTWHTGQMEKGSRGDDVSRAQTRLNSLNYLSGGVDGIYGGATASAITSFQKRNELSQTGVADEATIGKLFSSDAVKAPRPPKPYVLKISVAKQRVYAYSWSDADGDYTVLQRSMVCSTGLKSTPTPYGTFKSEGPVARWGYFPKWKVHAQYLFRIKGPILFHSVLYNSANESSLIQGSVAKLGQRASHGCVRLSVSDAKWIYNNCPAGTTVVVY